MRCEIKLQTDGYDDSTNDDDYHIWPGLWTYGIPIIMVKSVERVGATGGRGDNFTSQECETALTSQFGTHLAKVKIDKVLLIILV